MRIESGVDEVSVDQAALKEIVEKGEKIYAEAIEL